MLGYVIHVDNNTDPERRIPSFYTGSVMWLDETPEAEEVAFNGGYPAIYNIRAYDFIIAVLNQLYVSGGYGFKKVGDWWPVPTEHFNILLPDDQLTLRCWDQS